MLSRGGKENPSRPKRRSSVRGAKEKKKKKKEGEGMTKRHTHARISLAGSRRNVAVVVKRKRV